MAVDTRAVGARLFADVLAPLVLGGPMRTSHAIGARAAFALAEAPPALDGPLAERVERMRLQRARALVPIDEVGSPTEADWALGAALHDVVLAASPGLASPLRRRVATRMVDLAESIVDRVGPPRDLLAAVSRHTWFARVLEIARTDTTVSWWTGWRTFLGVEPPDRLLAWPDLRQVNVTRAERPLLKLAPLGFDASRLVDVVEKLLRCSPLTDLATCTRPAPGFGWSASSSGLLATDAGRKLALRALARLPAAETDAALGRATLRALRHRVRPDSILLLLAERAVAAAAGYAATGRAISADDESAATFARALGAAAASEIREVLATAWPAPDRERILAALAPAAEEGRAFLALFSL